MATKPTSNNTPDASDNQESEAKPFPNLSDFASPAASDKSYVANVPALTAALDQFLAAVTDYVTSARTLTEATRAAAFSMHEAKGLVLREDGTPDWAGRSYTWQKGIHPRIMNAFKGVNATKKERDDFEGAMRKASFDYGLTAIAIAEHKIATVNGLGAKQVVIVPKTKTTPEVKASIKSLVAKAKENAMEGKAEAIRLPDELHKAMNPDYRAQKSASTGNKYAGFEKGAPKYFGPKAVVSKQPGQKRTPASSTSLKSQWDTLQSAIDKFADGKTGNVAVLQFLTDFYATASKSATRIVGEPRKPAMKDIAERQACGDVAIELGDLFLHLGRYMKGQNGATKELVLKSRQKQDS